MDATICAVPLIVRVIPGNEVITYVGVTASQPHQAETHRFGEIADFLKACQFWDRNIKKNSRKKSEKIIPRQIDLKEFDGDVDFSLRLAFSRIFNVF